MNWNNKQVLVTGRNGFLGSAFIKMLNQKNPSEIITPSSKTHDLRIKENCDDIKEHRYCFSFSSA